ncbi:MAG TPA: glycosyltransferase, partial [Rhodopila sp.]|nr:glycosyltransferase [Rhodopila sp.]
MTQPEPTQEERLRPLLSRFLDPAWYLERYPDIAAAGLDPLTHFARFGIDETRDPNRFFDSAWYVEHNPDVAASGIAPLLHYLQAGAAELRNPHPRFDASWYVAEHPDAAVNPLLYHLQRGAPRGYATERPLAIHDYLPSTTQALSVPPGVFADVVIPVRRDLQATRRCLNAVLADRAFPLARIIVVDDHAPDCGLRAWLRELAEDGHIHLLRTPSPMGFAAAANHGIEAAEGHDVVLLAPDTNVPQGWLTRLAAHAYAQPNIATVSPLSGTAAIAPGDPAVPLDVVCRTVNTARSAATEQT